MSLAKYIRLGQTCFALILCLWTSLSCKKTHTPEELFAERASGVVLVRSKFYFKAYTEDGKTYYFSKFNKADNMYHIDNLSSDAGSISETTIYGSGFFVTKEGDILTAKNVVFGDIPVLDVEDALNRALDGELNNAEDLLVELEHSELEIRSHLREIQILPQENAKEIQQYAQLLRENLEEQKELGKSLEKMRQSRKKRRIEFVCHVGVAYNGSDDDDIEYQECTVRDVSTTAYHDLALIQLKSKETPRDSYIFDIDDYVQVDDISVGQKAYMIAFNEGEELARTGKGLRPQITTGEISREANLAVVLYTTPTLPGSSGAPVMDDKGRLLALNYGGMPEAEGFNYGMSMSATAAYFLDCQEQGRIDFRYLPQPTTKKEFTTKEEEEIDIIYAQDQLDTYYTNVFQGSSKLAVRAFSPTTIDQYHSLKNIQRKDLIQEINNYLKKYEIMQWDMRALERTGKQTFAYTLELKIRRHSDNILLIYNTEGTMQLREEEGRIYIASINDHKNKLISQSPMPKDTEESKDIKLGNTPTPSRNEENYTPADIESDPDFE